MAQKPALLLRSLIYGLGGAVLLLLALSLTAPPTSSVGSDRRGADGPFLIPGATENQPPLPWEYDPAIGEVAAKIAGFERASRWSQFPTTNQLDMQARYYDLDITMDPDAYRLDGIVTARFEVTATDVTELDLDLAEGLTATNVTQGGAPVTFVHQEEILTITLDRTYVQGEEVEVSVTYGGLPPSSYGAFGFDNHNGNDMIWSLSEPFGARSWWPCDDWSDDKPDSVDIRITVPAGLIVASNGTLEEVTYNGATDTYWWHESYPIATYLVSVAIYPYATYSDFYHYAPNDSMEIQFYIFPENVNSYFDENARIKDMIAYFATVYGEYPFLNEKYGQAEFLWGGAMEHQTCTSAGAWAFNEATIAHELAHQWWGDMVTCATFNHIWLNEGFARYSEAVWLDHQYGPVGFWGKMNSTRYYGSGTIYVPDLNDWNRIFNTSLSYNKASWVVHMLRGVFGDDSAFWQCLADYRAAYEGSAATTEQFQVICEAALGQDMTDFFQQWIYGEYYPKYGYEWSTVDLGDHYELHLAIDQLQTNTGLFHMPITLRVELAGGGSEDHVIDNSLAHQEYIIEIPEEAVAVALDPDDWILKQVQEPIVDPTFDQGILLVNGVHWDTYGTEITSAYESRAFWGDMEISFWDCFDEPAGGYPSTLPAPLGHGRVPSNILGSFETVIWLGNNYGGDIDPWINTSIMLYLEAGGNVLLMTRQGTSFLDTAMLSYLGLVVGGGTTLYDCISAHEDLQDIGRIGTQSYCMVFETAFHQEESTLLYTANQGYNPPMGIGVMRAPAAGGTYNPNGGRFGFLSGRPYRWNHADLAGAVEIIVQDLFTYNAADAPEADSERRLGLRLTTPALGSARMGFSLPQDEQASLTVYDCQGRLVQTLLDGELTAGEHVVNWNGSVQVGAGLYFVRLQTAHADQTRALLMLK